MEVELEVAGTGDAVLLPRAAAAAPLPGPRRIAAHAELLQQEGVGALMRLDRPQPVVAMREGAKRAAAIMRRGRAVTADAPIMAVEEAPVGALPVEAYGGMAAEMARRHLGGHGMLHGPDHRVDGAGQRRRIAG